MGIELALEQFGEDLKNKYCNLKNLKNETDVRELFLAPLLDELGFTEDYRETERLPEKNIGKGKKKRVYKPDYVCYSDKAHNRPVLIVDAKSPTENAEEGVEDAQLYTAVIRRALDEPKPVQHCIGCNGVRTIIKHYDSNKTEQDLQFSDFQDGKPKFESFKTTFSRSALSKSVFSGSEPFEFHKPPKMSEVTGIFEACHDIIRRRDAIGQEGAFYEFTKVMFVKLNEDKRLRTDPDIEKLIEAGKPLPREKVRFSIHWIVQNEDSEPHPVNTILFKQLRELLELEIINKKKKRIFDDNENIKLKPDTVKEIVKLLEHLDLFGIDEDLNGRLFETFLSATMRGEKLGQFFTPRTVVEFMTKLADLQADEKRIDRVLDGCCGTGGFLIEAMTEMARQVRHRQNLNDKQKEELIKEIRDNRLVGIDIGQEPRMAQIARINMYLHEDGGSRVYFADALDKDVKIEDTLTPEVKAEREELRELLRNVKFNVILTNPPFAMPKKAREKDAKTILEKYNLAYYLTKKKTRKLRSSLESNVMFLERYHELLAEDGKLITVIDESVLNTDTDKPARDFIFENFLVKAIISLPRMTFRRAGANVKTSILYLAKKQTSKEGQPATFYGMSENTGFDPDNVQKLDPSRSDLEPVVLKKWKEFQTSGKL
jgi:type I restriction enzyme M protein